MVRVAPKIIETGNRVLADAERRGFSGTPNVVWFREEADRLEKFYALAQTLLSTMGTGRKQRDSEDRKMHNLYTFLLFRFKLEGQPSPLNIVKRLPGSRIATSTAVLQKSEGRSR